MPRGRSYGDKLRIARERAGIDVVTLAKRLHVRPDILKAIENADFDRMPARGYTRNMIRAYARQVGLDEKEVSEMYLDEIHLFETGSPRLSRSSSDAYKRSSSRAASSRADDYPPRSTRSSSRDYPRSQSFEAAYSREVNRNYSRSTRRQSVAFSDDYPQRGSVSSDRGYRSQRDADRSIRFASSPSRRFDDERRDYIDDTRRATSSRSIPVRDNRDMHSRSQGASGQRQGVSSSRRRPITLTQSSHSYADLYSNNRSKPKVPELNMPLLIIIGVVVIAVIIAVVVLFNSSTQSVDEIPDIPIAGYSDTSNPEQQIDPIATLPEPTSVEVTYKVESGERSYIEIYENGASKPIFDGVVTGPATETFEVTGTLTFEAANPTPVTLTVDGEEVSLTKSPSSGYYTYTVDFSAILAKWRAENDPSYAAGSSASNTSNSSTSTNTNSNTNSNSNKASNSTARNSSGNTSNTTSSSSR